MAFEGWILNMVYPNCSVLGPLLFIIYVNDIVNAVKDIKIRLFADDTARFIHGKDVEMIYNINERRFD